MKHYLALLVLPAIIAPAMAQSDANLAAWEGLRVCAEIKAAEYAAIDNPLSELARASLMACDKERKSLLAANLQYYQDQGDKGEIATKRATDLTQSLEQSVLDKLVPILAEAKK